MNGGKTFELFGLRFYWYASVHLCHGFRRDDQAQTGEFRVAQKQFEGHRCECGPNFNNNYVGVSQIINCTI